MRAVFQPIVDTSGGLIGFEALARWHSPVLGSVGPDKFVPIAERIGTIRPLTLAIAGKSFRMLAAAPDSVRIKLNLSVIDLASLEHLSRS